MFWSKKDEKKSLPDLPPYRGSAIGGAGEMSGTDSSGLHMGDENESGEAVEKHELPSFPDSMNDKGFSQAAIRDAVGDAGEEPGDISTYPEQLGPKTINMEEWKPSIKEEPQKLPMGNFIPEKNTAKSRIGLKEPPSINYDRAEEFVPPKKNADIYVKLDKFYLARKSLMSAQQKLHDIDELLRRIRETKLREEQELDAWEKDLITIKTRMNDVEMNLFEKVD